jgi:transposase
VEKHGPDVGSISAVKRLFARLKQASGPSPGDVAIPVHTAPEQQAQVDFGYVGELRDPQSGVLKKAWVFGMTLSHSRALFARIVFHQDLTTWLSLHRAAFQWFGGVPREGVPDNLKAAVIHAAFKADEMGALNRSYRDLGRSYWFLIDPTPAYSPQKKGKVESAVKYVKTFLTPRVADFSDIDQANERLQTWVRKTANRWTHGTTGRVPQDVLDETERVAMLSLPAHPIVAAEWRELSVGRNSHVTLDKRFYSVP